MFFTVVYNYEHLNRSAIEAELLEREVSTTSSHVKGSERKKKKIPAGLKLYNRNCQPRSLLRKRAGKKEVLNLSGH